MNQSEQAENTSVLSLNKKITFDPPFPNNSLCFFNINSNLGPFPFQDPAGALPLRLGLRLCPPRLRGGRQDDGARQAGGEGAPPAAQGGRDLPRVRLGPAGGLLQAGRVRAIRQDGPAHHGARAVIARRMDSSSLYGR